jgi:hypothetical protein
MIVRELYAKLGLEFDDTKLKKVEEKLDGLKETLTTIGISVTAASATLFGFAKFTADAGEEASKAAQKLGISVGALQRLETAAYLGDVSMESLQQSLGILSRQLVSARDGSADAAKALRKVGIDTRAFGGHLPTTTQALSAIADRFASMPDGVEKSALAMDLFGRAGRDMIPFLNKGSAEIAKSAAMADKYGTVLSDVDVQLSNEFNDTIKESTLALKGLRNILGVGLIKVIKPLAEQFNVFISENRVRLAERIRFVFDGMARFVQIVWKAMLALVESVGGFLETFGGLQKVATVLGTIAAIFLGGKLLYGIGSVVLAIWNAVAAFAAMDIAALAIPIAIGAAVVAIGLLIDDVITFFQGGDSYFGRLVSWFDGITSRLGGWGTAIKAILASILAPIRYLILGFRSLLTLIDMIRGKTGAKEGFGNILSNLGNAFTGGLQKGNEASLLDLLGFGGMSPTSSPTTGTSNIQAPVRVDSNMTFNVGPNVDPTTVAPKLQNSIDDGFQALIRKANSSYLGEGAPVY